MNEAAERINSFAVHFTVLPLWLLPILIAAGIALALWYYHDPVPPLSRGMRRLLVTLRAGAFALLLIALAEPVLGVVRTITRTFRVAVLLDTSSSMVQPDDPARQRDALDALDAIRLHLGKRGMYVAFDARHRPLDGGPPVFEGNATDLADALKKAAAERDVIACVVIGDGRWNRGEDPTETALPEDTPVYTVLSGSTSAAPDVAIRRVSQAPVGRDGASIPVEISVAAHGTPGGAIPVQIAEKDHPIVSGKITLPENSAGRIILDLPLSGPGEHVFTARVLPPFADRGENNARSFGVRVLKSRFCVLIVSPGPSPDLAFIRRTIEADSAFAVRTVIASGSAGDPFPEKLDNIDATILLDGGGTAITSDRARRIASRVTEGMGLWILGSTPVTQGSPLERVLAVSFERNTPVRSGTTASLTESGRGHAVTGGNASHNPWEDLPPLPALSSVRPMEKSIVLAVSTTTKQRPDITPVLVAGISKKGKTLALPASGLWRWRLMMEGAGKSGKFFDDFIRDAAHWITSETEIAPLTVTTGAKTYLCGEEVLFEARVFDTAYRSVSGAEVSVVPDGDSAGKVILTETRTGIYTGSTASAVPGGHAWTATAFVDSRRHGEASGKYTVEPFSLETLDPSPDPESFGRLAARSGGIAVTAAGIDSVLGRLTPRSVSERVENKSHLTLNPFLPGMIILLLGIEWFLRKRRGMI